MLVLYFRDKEEKEAKVCIRLRMRRMLTYDDVSYDDVCCRMLVLYFRDLKGEKEAKVCIRLRMRRMLTYADVC
jgi:hypothetical protein